MKPARTIGGVALAAILVALVGIWAVDRVARTAMEDALGEAFGTEASVETVDVGILSGRVDVEGVMVANPEGFESPHFFALADTRATAGLSELWGDTVTIRRVSLEGLEIFLEREGARTNFGPVLDRLRAGRDDGASDGRVYRIEELVLRNTVARVRFGRGGSGEASVEVPEVRLQGLGTGSDGAMPLGRVAGAVLRAALEGVTRRSGGLPVSLGALRGELDALGALPGSLDLGGSSGEGKGVGEKVREKLEGVLPGGG